MDCLDALISLIIAGNFATAKDTDIFKDYLPDSPANLVAPLEYQGSPPGVFTDLSVRSIQINVRNTSVVAAKALAWNIYNYLYKEDLLLPFNGHVAIISMRCTPFKSHVDAAGRTVFVFNLALTTKFD